MAEDYSELGKMLKAAREAVPMSIEHASQALHIRARYLVSLEAGKLYELPGHAYAKGYLLAYAGLLNMDRHEIQRQFEMVEGHLKRGFYFPSVLNREKSVTPIMTWGALAAAVFAYLVWSLAMRPPQMEAQDIEAWRQQLLKKGHVSAFVAKNAPCFRAQDILYPACYAQEPDLEVLPLTRRARSVMDLRI
jgi:cytoskeletal protein RodZ